MSTEVATAAPADDPRKRQIAAMCWTRGTEAMAKETWDYAIQMFGQCAQLVPSNLVYRQTLRNCTYKKYKNNGTGAGMSGMRLMGIRSKIKKARTAKNWTEMDLAAEEGLVVNPWDGQLNADLGEAAQNLGNDDVALFAYELAVKSDMKNKEFWKGLAGARAQKHDYIGAGNCWREIYKIDPLDGQARSMAQAMDSQATIHKSGIEHAESTREVKQGYEASVKGKSSESVITPGESPEHDLQRAIRKDPANKDNYTKLADLYRREGKLQQALDSFIKGFEVSGDPSIKEQAEDVQLEMLRKNLDAARTQASKKPDDAHLKEGVMALHKELLSQEIEVFTRRTERYPKDLRMKYELAQRLVKVKQFPQAIKLLQQASSDVRMEGPVLLELAKVFLQQKQNALAQRQFEKAVARFSAADTPEEFIVCHYWLGRLAEEGKDLDAAERHYTEVIAVEFDYKDAHERLTKIQGSRGGGALEGVDDL